MNGEVVIAGRPLDPDPGLRFVQLTDPGRYAALHAWAEEEVEHRDRYRWRRETEHRMRTHAARLGGERAAREATERDGRRKDPSGLGAVWKAAGR